MFTRSRFRSFFIAGVVGSCLIGMKVSSHSFENPNQLSAAESGYRVPAVTAPAPSSRKATILVTTTSDTGPGSLRNAIETAGGNNTIAFNIPGFSNGPFVIKLNSALPPLPIGTVIDGSTQAENAGTDPNPNGPDIFLDATSSGIATAITISASQCVVRGIGIFGASNTAILITGSFATGNRVEGCYIGTNKDATDQATRGNNIGILLANNTTSNVIGGTTPAARNIISGNTNHGIVLDGAFTRSNQVLNNVIGLNRQLTEAIGNGTSGIVLQNGASSNQIGGVVNSVAVGNHIGGNNSHGIVLTGANTGFNMVQANVIGTNASRASLGNGGDGVRLVSGALRNVIGGAAGSTANIIAFSGGSGVKIGVDKGDVNTQRNTISQNQIFGSKGLRIDLGDTGETQNDAADSDTGPNTLINKPVITTVANVDGELVIQGTYDDAEAQGNIEVFANFPEITDPKTAPNQQFLATKAVGSTFMVTVPLPTGRFTVSATFTDNLGNTSEFSNEVEYKFGPPDLIVEGLSVTPAATPPGGVVEVSFVIANQGFLQAQGSTALVVYSTNNVIDTSDFELMPVNIPPIPAQGKTNVIKVEVTVPALPISGNVFLGVIADSQRVVTESNETNNTASAPVTVTPIETPKLDLSVSGLTVSQPGGATGTPLSVSFVVANSGPAVATPTTSQMYFSTDSTITPTDTLVGTLNTPAIESSASVTVTGTVTVPEALPAGNYFLGVMVDANRQLNETSETNNTAAVRFTVGGLADLSVPEMTVTPTLVSVGDEVTVSATLQNQGMLAAPASRYVLVVSADATIGDEADAIVLTQEVASIPSNQTVQVSAQVRIPAVPAGSGTLFLGLVADSENAVEESSETNNTASAQLSLKDTTPPMVRILKPNGGEAIAAGRTFETIEWTASDNLAVVSQEIRLSTNGGASFPIVILTGLSSEVRSLAWDVPADLNTTTARIQVVIQDAEGNEGQGISLADFTVARPPVIVSPPKLKKTGKLVFQATNANILAGAQLLVTVAENTETFDLSVSSKTVLVKPGTRSVPGDRPLSQVLTKGTTATLIIRNPNGVTSTPLTFTVQ
ncbi:MAG TPA: CARDB domain-containing protein [Acidobacteriota bacterium]|nr:CARDB domain-containing protein [Acidobacteriota bacterium]